MKAILCIALFISLAVSSFAEDFTRKTSFKSAAAFAAAARAFKPNGSDSDLAKLFTILEEKDVTPPATANSIESGDVIWEGKEDAIVFVTAQPPTRFTRWKVGILFYLIREGDQWRISDIHRFDAQNKQAEITCHLTSGEKTETVVTITVTRGRREWASSMSASYSPSGKKLVRLDPEQE